MTCATQRFRNGEEGNTIEAVWGRRDSLGLSQRSQITMQAKPVKAARRGHKKSLEAAQPRTEWGQVLGKGYLLNEGSREGAAPHRAEPEGGLAVGEWVSWLSWK